MKKLNKLFSKHIDESEMGTPVDSNGNIKVNFFLNLLTATHDDKNLDLIAEIFFQFINQKYNLDDYDGIVCPKIGNVLLCAKVAQKLNKPKAFVKHSMMFNNWIEGDIISGKRVLLIDDISAEGEIVLDTVNSLKDAGIYVLGALVLVHRIEGDSISYLKNNNIRFDFLMQLSDDDLKKIKYGN